MSSDNKNERPNKHKWLVIGMLLIALIAMIIAAKFGYFIGKDKAIQDNARDQTAVTKDQ